MKSGEQHVAGLRDGRPVPMKRQSVPVSVGSGATASHTPELAASSAADFVTACLLAA